MNATPEVHSAWLSSYVLLVSVVQILLVGYRWRGHRRRLLLFLLGGAIMAVVWGAAILVPFKSSVTVKMPPGRSSGGADAIADIISTTIVIALVVGINQLTLLGVRAGLDRKGK